MSKKRNVPAHGRKAARSRRPRKRRFLVVAGGAVTEKQYFKQLESLYDVIIDYQQKNNSPKQLAKLAVKLKREDKRDTSTDCYERIWVVVDVDDFHDHGEAARICNDNGIELIISNPCFEVWFLQHFRYSTKSYASNDEVIRDLITYIPGYKKNANVYDLIAHAQEHAVKRAKQLEQHHAELGRKKNSMECNPSTDAYKVLEIT